VIPFVLSLLLVHAIWSTAQIIILKHQMALIAAAARHMAEAMLLMGKKP
jgi:hypothetical protein